MSWVFYWRCRSTALPCNCIHLWLDSWLQQTPRLGQLYPLVFIYVMFKTWKKLLLDNQYNQGCTHIMGKSCLLVTCGGLSDLDWGNQRTQWSTSVWRSWEICGQFFWLLVLQSYTLVSLRFLSCDLVANCMRCGASILVISDLLIMPSHWNFVCS